MERPARFKLKSRHLNFALLALVLVLAAIMIAGAFGYHLEEKLFSYVTDGVMIAAIGILLVGRRIRAEEQESAREEGTEGKDEGK